MDNNRERNPEQYKGKPNGKGKASKPRAGKAGKPSSNGSNTSKGDSIRKDCDRLKDAPNNKEKRQDAEIIDTLVRSRENPAAWYKKYPDLFASVTNHYFGLPLGIQWEFVEKTGPTTSPGLNVPTNVLPGVIEIKFISTPGYSKDNRSAINVAALDNFSYMKNKQRITGNFDWADTMIYVMCVDSLRMWCKAASRIYAVAKQMPKLNYYYAQTLLAAMGVPFNTINQDFSDMRAAINIVINQVNRLNIPKGMSLLERHEWMCEGLYVDSTAEQAQTYVFTPDQFWLYDNTVTTGSQLTPLDANVGSWEAYLELAHTMLDQLMGDEDTGFISAAFRAAYDGQLEPGLPEIGESYEILPVYNEMVLMQIENAQFAGIPVVSKNVITQDPSINGGAILYEPQFVMPDGGYGDSRYFNLTHVLNSHNALVTADDLVEMTRWQLGVKQTLEYGSAYNPVSFGSEILLFATIFIEPDIVGDGNAQQLPYITNILSDWKFSTDVTAVGLANAGNAKAYFSSVLSALAKFDWHFAVWVTETEYQIAEPGDAITASQTTVGPIYDVDNFTSISYRDLEQLHYVAMTSLFKTDVM